MALQLLALAHQFSVTGAVYCTECGSGAETAAQRV